MTRKWAERMFSVLLMALAASAYWQTIDLKKQAVLLMGPAFFPQLTSIILFVCSMITLGKTIFLSREASETMVLPPPRVIMKILLFLALISLILLIITYTGWLMAQLILVFMIEIIFGNKKWKHSLIIAIAAVIFIYSLFELGLGIRLPRGIFEDII